MPDIRRHILEGTPSFPAYVVTPEGVVREVSLSVGELTVPERETLISGCLINYYRNHRSPAAEDAVSTYKYRRKQGC